VLQRFRGLAVELGLVELQFQPVSGEDAAAALEVQV
jgi:hypothetical protein